MSRKYEEDSLRKGLARAIASEAMVLLKNEDNCLPLKMGATVAVLGQTQNETIIGGGGSGASRCDNPLQINTELKEAGLVLEPMMDAFYKAHLEEKLAKKAAEEAERGPMDFIGLITSGLIYEFFGTYSGPEIEAYPAEDVYAASAKATDTAICIIGRKSGGEECDRHVDDDYYLLESEIQMVANAAKYYKNVIVVFNVNGAVDMAWMSNYPQIKAAIFMGTAGEQGAGALADILVGKVSPSGKLAQTMALAYEDHPTAKNISWNKSDPEALLTYESYGLSSEENGSVGFNQSAAVVYEEDIYVGYRYFDTFDKDVLYPFGYGLSYADFAWECCDASVADGKLTVEMTVGNISETYSGKESMQLYVHAPSVNLDKPYQELKAFAKTDVLAPGEKQNLTLTVDLKDLASFDEETMSYVIEPGTYSVFVGNSSKNTDTVACISVDEEIVTRTVTADIGFKEWNKDKISVLCPETEEEADISIVMDIDVLHVKAEDVVTAWPEYKAYDFNVPAQESVLKDAQEGRVSIEAFVNQMSVEELAVLCNDYGPGLPFFGAGNKNAPSTIQYEDGTDMGYNSHKHARPGFCNPAMDKYGIYSVCYQDGPASCGITAFPTGMMLACTFNPELAYEFGHACGYEAEIQSIDSWLAPGMNIIRNPIEGRAFEYFSEDPYLTGVYATNIAKGAMENNQVTVCPKHFAVNEQETYRRGSAKKNIDAVDSIVSARAAREIYLKPFEMVITEAKPATIMSSFNKLNGTFAAGNSVLCTEILRGEWGYDGTVVTDWGDLDFYVDGADAVEAGNDVVMPGGPPVIAQVLKGYEEGRVTVDKMKEAVAHLLKFVMNSKSYEDMVK